MMQRVKIGPAAEQDLQQLAEIAAVSFPDPWSERLFREAFASPYTQITAARTDSGEIAGYLVLSQAGDEMNVDDIAVSPGFRRTGVGRMLLETAHRTYPERNFLLEVRETNKPALALYEALGYRQVGYRKRYYRNPDEGAVLMTKTKERDTI
ncbi:MAG: ribosomal protein S18-alanine N-acetyltransferase [Ruminococcus sp.]|nr:ribosomal protein S18-alanine N-acetyltransferase [Ruminococcus sp.]